MTENNITSQPFPGFTATLGDVLFLAHKGNDAAVHALKKVGIKVVSVEKPKAPKRPLSPEAQQMIRAIGA